MLSLTSPRHISTLPTPAVRCAQTAVIRAADVAILLVAMSRHSSCGDDWSWRTRSGPPVATSSLPASEQTRGITPHGARASFASVGLIRRRMRHDNWHRPDGSTSPRAMVSSSPTMVELTCWSVYAPSNAQESLAWIKASNSVSKSRAMRGSTVACSESQGFWIRRPATERA